MLLGTQRLNDRDHLEIGGCDTVELAERFGTPLYVMDEQLIRDNCRKYLAAFGKRYPRVKVPYAGKAFLTMAMARIIQEEGLCLDVASGGELYTALEAGFPADRLVLHGNNKSEEELTLGLQSGVGRIVADSVFELEMLDRLTRELGRDVSILLRTKPGIDPHTHRRIQTGQEDSKFGLGIKTGEALEAIKLALTLPRVKLTGIHCHIGSQLLHLDTHLDAIQILVDFMKEVQDATGATLDEVNVGGGVGIRYLPEHQPPSIDEFAERLIGTLEQRLEESGLPRPVLEVEPGRSIVGEAGTTLYRVGGLKDIEIPKEPGRRIYVNIDGGMSDNPRPQLYEAVYSCALANRSSGSETRTVTIAGKHCETDILIWDTSVLLPRPGDLLAVQSTGAYNYAMASNYNRLPRPAVVLVKDGQADLIVQRETYQDLIRQDRIPTRLT
ncbi:MAG TPA: diaminopimelate decarboxylase [Armatimonadota bacterium]